MSIFDVETPVTRLMDPHERMDLDHVYEVIRDQIGCCSGAQPYFLGCQLFVTRRYTDGVGTSPRFMARWEKPLSEKQVDLIEDVYRRHAHPSEIQGRRTPIMERSRVLNYHTFSGFSRKQRGHLIKKWEYTDRKSAGIWVTRIFSSRSEADRGVKRRDWLYGGRGYVELKEGPGITQLDFSRLAIQLGVILAQGRTVDDARLTYDVYRALNAYYIEAVAESDIAGLDDELEFIKWVIFASGRNPDAARHFGFEPESVMLAGIGGVGKTLMAQYLARADFGSLFIPVSGISLLGSLYETSDSDGEKPETFFTALQSLRNKSGVGIVLHFDDAEAVMKIPDNGNSKECAAQNSALLNFLSGVRTHDIHLMGSTNKPWDVDPRFLRAGRIGHMLHVQLPDKEARYKTLEIHTRRRPVRGVDLNALAKKTDCFTPASLESICNQAAGYALRRCAKSKGKKNGFDALPMLTEDDTRDAVITDEDFQEAYKAVSKSTDPQSNIGADRKIGEFCKTYNAGIGFEQASSARRGQCPQI